MRELIWWPTELGHWVIGNTQKRVEACFDLPPFTRWFKPNSAVEIMSGDIVVLSAFSLGDLVQLFSEKGISATFEIKKLDLFPISLSTPFIEEQKKTCEYISNIGNWQRKRVLYSFLALESFVEVCTFMASPGANQPAKSKLGTLGVKSDKENSGH
jgi:hypothetical protein